MPAPADSYRPHVGVVAREALEETGVTIDPADLSFAHLCHHADPDDLARVGLDTHDHGTVFTLDGWG